MSICQYTHKKAILVGFSLVFCFAFLAHAEPPNLLVSPDIQKVIDGFVESIVNAEIKEKEKKIDAMFPEPRSDDDKRRVKTAKEALAAAAEASKGIIRTQLTQACFEARCQTDTVKELAEAYVVKTEASKMLDDYMKAMGGFVTQAERQSAAMRAALNKLNTGIADGNAKVNAWWNFFGIGEAALREAQTARVQAQQIAKDIKEINALLVQINQELKDLQDGVKKGTLSAKEAEAAMAYIQSLIVDIQRLIADAIAYLQKPELASVVAKNAPEMNLAERIREAKAIEKQIIDKVAEADSKKADEAKALFLNSLPIPVDITKPLSPQLKVPPKAKPCPPGTGSGTATPPGEDPAVDVPELPPVVPPVNPPPKNVLSWVRSYRPVIGSNGSVLYYELFDASVPPKMILRTGPKGSAAVQGSTPGSSLYLYYATPADAAAGRPSVGEYIPSVK